MPTFTDENIERLFGAEDAEHETEERFRQYFFYNKTYDNLVSNLPIRILVGHKGVGKSALLKRSHLQDKDNKLLSVWLRPSEVSTIFVPSEIQDFNKLVEHWKQGILSIIARHILGEAADEITKDQMRGLTTRVSSFVTALTSKLSGAAGVVAQEIQKGIWPAPGSVDTHLS